MGLVGQGWGTSGIAQEASNFAVAHGDQINGDFGGSMMDGEARGVQIRHVRVFPPLGHWVPHRLLERGAHAWAPSRAPGGHGDQIRALAAAALCVAVD